MSLILTRRVGQTIMIDDDITVTVVSVINGNIRIAINAPKNVAVHREEVYNDIQAKQH